MRRHRGYWRLPGAKVAESRGVWLKARRRRECLSVDSCAALSPSPTKTGSPSRRGLPLPVQPPRHACELLWAGGVDDVRGESPTQRRLVPLRSGTGSPGAGKGREGAPRPRSAPPTPILHQRPPLLRLRFKDGPLLVLPPPLAPPKAGTRARGAQATGMKFALSPRCALNASRLQEGLSTPYLSSPPANARGRRRRAPPGSLTSSPVHHLFGAPLGHGLHGG